MRDSNFVTKPMTGMASIPTRILQQTVLLATAMLFAHTIVAQAPLNPLQQAPSLIEQRALYQQAQQAQARGQTSELRDLMAQLEDYPLHIYLEYNTLRPALAGWARTGNNEGFATVDDFLVRHRDSYLGNRLEREWVSALADHTRWSDVARYHRMENTNTTLTCRALRAQLELGNTAALVDVAPLWNVDYSQPNDCDPVFEAWLAQGFLEPGIAWQRFTKTLQSRQLGLARYVSRLMPERERQLSEVFLRIDSQPERLLTDSALTAQEPEIREIILHGVRRLALVDATQALTALNKHQQVHQFSADDVNASKQFIAQRSLQQGLVTQTENLLANEPDLGTETLVGWILRDAIRNQDWQRMASWLPRLPDDAINTERWKYWRARTLEQLNATGVDNDSALPEAQDLYYELAQTRSFYGFLAADKLGLPYELVDRPVPVRTEDVSALYSNPAIQRAHELYVLGDELSARNEWQFAQSRLSAEQLVSSGLIADSWGWHRNGIQAMIRAQYWDDLQLRFPLAYGDLFASAATQLDVSQQLLFAIARQESAFMHDVRSSAGALGLMQLMPATGRETASRAGLRINDQDLLRPEINIQLGSRYLAQLLNDFDGNRALAAAAYNAGPNRVRQWLRQTGNNPLPLDAWIETIPFAETRNYVQNVLAFSVIYGYRMGQPTRFLSEQEINSNL
ncbi:MAG: transglycosylase SLT domain-containing protein [Pseudohongiella sp.]|nr:transglycosylase SLT domain-containing protein [Pseudohongiella sp.]